MDDRTIRKIERKLYRKLYFINDTLYHLRNLRKSNKLVYVDPSDGEIYYRDYIHECRGEPGIYHYAWKIIKNYKREKSNYLHNVVSRYYGLKHQINELEQIRDSIEEDSELEKLKSQFKKCKRGVRKMSIYQV